MKKPAHQSIVDYISNMNMDAGHKEDYELSEEELHQLWIRDLAFRLERGTATAEDMLDIIQYSNDIGQRLRYNLRIKRASAALNRT